MKDKVPQKIFKNLMDKKGGEIKKSNRGGIPPPGQTDDI